MPKTRNNRIGECIYCGAIGCVTGDHVPPKNLFPPPRPNNLIVVPSCLPCNQSASLDDEYFRLTLSLRDDTRDHPAVGLLLPSVRRSLANPRKAKFTRAFRRGITRADIETPAGIFLGQGPAYQVDLRRLEVRPRRAGFRS